MEHGHSLEQWGLRFNYPKIEFSDFSKFTPEMLTYCEQDVNLTERLFLAITKRMIDRGYSEKSCELEHQIRVVIDEQQRNGFYFDIKQAETLLAELHTRQENLGGTIHSLFPPVLRPIKRYTYRTKDSGEPYASYQRHLIEYPKVERVGDQYTVYDWREFNIGSPDQRVEKLLGLGYKPTKFTKGGSPKVDEEAILSFLETAEGKVHYDEVSAIANWLVVTGRSNMVNTWLECVDRTDSCIHGRVFTCGASTRRMTHNSPNTANIPKAKDKVQYGKLCRQLWRARPGRVLVGYDASSLEMRMFCHYLGNPEVTQIYINGDPHGRNAEALSSNEWGFTATRDGGAKNGYYAFIYGAQDEKLGATLDPHGGHTQYGKWARAKLFEITPGLEELVKRVQAEWRQTKEWLKTIDGGYVRCPSPHAALNYKCQSAGGLVMKQTTIFADQRFKEKGLDVIKVGDIHDEGQLDCDPKDAEEAGKIAVQAHIDAGEELNFTVPLNGNYKIGSTWADTH